MKVLLIILLLLTFAGDTRHASVDVRPTPTIVSQGSPVGLVISVTNDGEKTMRVSTETEVFTPCGEAIDVDYSYQRRLQPGQSFNPNTVYHVPADGCLGVYEVAVSVWVGNTWVGGGWAEFEVREF